MKFKKGSIRRSLRFSLADGLFSAMMMGISDNYLIPYGIALGATPSQIAFLASVPVLIGALLQSRSAAVIQSIGSRTKLINFMVFFHALAWLPIILVPYIFGRPVAPWALLGTATLFVSFGAFSLPAWQSLMSDYIPVKKRGKYFGWRNRLQGILMVLASVSAGLILDRFGKDRVAGFTIIFVFAMLCRFSAWACLTRMTEPFRHTSHDVYFSFLNFLKRMRTTNFGKFVLFVALMSFSVNLSAPLLSVFLLRDLGLDYAAFMLIVTGSASSAFLFQGFWGRYGDRFGNMRVLRYAGWGIALIPVLWMFSLNLFWILIVQCFAGCVWGGFNLLVVNFMMEAVSPQKRIRCISYFNVMNAIFILLGALLSGVLIHHVRPVFGYSYLTLFLISCVARIGVMIFGTRCVREVRARYDARGGIPA